VAVTGKTYIKNTRNALTIISNIISQSSNEMSSVQNYVPPRQLTEKREPFVIVNYSCNRSHSYVKRIQVVCYFYFISCISDVSLSQFSLRRCDFAFALFNCLVGRFLA